MAPQEAPELAYIVGASRSGSTILCALLGGQDGYLAVGELNRVLDLDRGRPPVCSCGQPLDSCELWSRVLEEWPRRATSAVLTEYPRLQPQHERIRRVPGLLARAKGISPESDKYGAWTRDLLRALQDVSGARVIVDSSKHPARALSLYHSQGISAAFLHLVRDPRAVVWSWWKTNGRYWSLLPPPLNSNRLLVTLVVALDWVVVNWIAGRLCRRPQVRAAQLRYEDLVSDPRAALARIAALFPADLQESLLDAPRGPIAFGHIVAGNRARHGGPTALRADTEWEARAPSWMRALVWIVCGPLARRYGYRR
jgi:hypothetical protein